MTPVNSALLWAYDIASDGSASPVSADRLSTAVPALCYRWVHMQSDSADAEQLIDNMALSTSVGESLMALQTRPRVIPMSDGTLAFLRGINANPGADPEDMVALRLWITPTLIVTARRHERKLVSVQDTHQQVEEGNAPTSSAELLVVLLTRIADRIQHKVEEIDEHLGEYEAAEMLNKQDRHHLSMLRRQTASIRRYLAPQRDALEALGRVQGLLDSTQIFNLRDQSDRMTRSIEDLDLARERAIVLQDELRNQVSDKQNIRMYVLSMVTAIFLPLSFLTGVFGMNVAGLPGTETPDGFFNLMVSMGALAVVMLLAMLWKKWL